MAGIRQRVIAGKSFGSFIQLRSYTYALVQGMIIICSYVVQHEALTSIARKVDQSMLVQIGRLFRPIN